MMSKYIDNIFLRHMIGIMNSYEALPLLKAEADRTSWEAVADAMGFDMALVYAWWRRGNIPEWRMEQVRKYLQKQRRKAA
jgi:hypothetical protein